jgi:2'-5' RNA ligase
LFRCLIVLVSVGKLAGEIIRSFIAFDVLEPNILRRIIEVQEALLATGADLKMVEPQNIHITMKFLGDILSSQIDDVYEAMKNSYVKPFDVALRNMGVFPSFSRMNVVWIGITNGFEELSRIAEQLETELKSHGFPPENRKFSAHFTIARVKSAENKDALARKIDDLAGHEFGSSRMSSLKLKKSVLTPSGPIYSTLREVTV